MPEEQQGNTESQTAENSSEQTATTLTQTTETKAEGAQTTETGTKAEGTQTAEETGKQSAAEENQSKAPEEYADFTVPEGQEINTDLTGKFKTLAKDLNLTQEQAQTMFSLGTEMRNADVEAQTVAWQEQRAEWVKTAKIDPEIGGAVFDANVNASKQVLADYGNEGLVNLLNESGYGDHPEVLRFLTKLSKVTGERSSAGGNRAEGEVSAAEVLFPNQGKEK